MPERLTASERAALQRLADGKSDGLGVGIGFRLFFGGLAEINAKGEMRISEAGRRALEDTTDDRC